MIVGALGDFRRTWPQLLVTDLMARGLAILLLTLALGVLFKVFLRWADDGVLTDLDILTFLTHPIGIVAFVAVAAVSFGVLFAHSGALMVIGFGAIEDRRITWVDAVRYLGRRLGSMGRLAAAFVVRVGLVSLPFLVAILLVHELVLGEHDINYYLAARPPELRLAVFLAGVLSTGLAVWILRLLGGWLLAVPLILFGGVRGKTALGKSAEALEGREWRVTLLLGAWLAVLASLSSVATLAIALVSGRIVPELGGNLVVYAAWLALTVVVTLVVNLAVSMLATSLFALMVARLYLAAAGPGRLDPAPRERGSLGAKAVISVPGKRYLASGAFLVVLVVGGAYAESRTLDAEESVQVIAHRGASLACPENTMAAFERAMADGADWIELDVQENAAGTVVVFHDSDFMRQAGSPLKVWEARDEDLRDLDIGSWFGPGFGKERVPTLKRVLAAARGRVGVVIELKYYGHDEDLEARVVEVVEESGMASHVMVMSLKLEGVKKLAAMRPEWPRGFLNTVSVGDLTGLDLQFLALQTRAATRRMIRRAHRRGVKVFVWTVNDPVQMSIMMSRGADGLITDAPETARKVLEFREELGPFGRFLVWFAGESGLLRLAENAPETTGS